MDHRIKLPSVCYLYIFPGIMSFLERIRAILQVQGNKSIR